MNLEETNKSEPTYEEFVEFMDELKKNEKRDNEKDGEFSEQGMKEYIEQIRKNSRNAITVMIVKEEDL